jgi:hypothetical protein
MSSGFFLLCEENDEDYAKVLLFIYIKRLRKIECCSRVLHGLLIYYLCVFIKFLINIIV